jgi:ABC-type transport system substrate-binding protein
MRLAFAVAYSWKKNGIDANVQQMDGATFWDSESTGAFEVGSYWPACGLLPDSTANFQGWHKQYIVDNGKQAPGNRNRWANDKVSSLIDELAGMQSSDPKVIANITEINKKFVKGMPFIPMFGTSKFVPVDTVSKHLRILLKDRGGGGGGRSLSIYWNYHGIFHTEINAFKSRRSFYRALDSQVSFFGTGRN